MLDMQALERALAPVEAVGRDEITFTAEDHTITLRPILPHEEVVVQKRAQAALADQKDDEGTDRYAALDYFNTFRIETLSFALAEVNGLDLREVEYVATGEKTEGGKPVRVPRNAAVRKMLQRWSLAMLKAAYGQYAELLTRIGEKGEKLVEYEPADIKAELERLKKRQADLEDELQRRAEGDPNLTAEQVRAIQEGAEAATHPLISTGDVAESERPPRRRAPPAEEPVEPPEPAETTSVADEEQWATFDDLPGEAELRRTPAEPPPETVPEPEPDEPTVQPPAPQTRQPVTPPTSPPPGEPDAAGNTVPDPLADVMDSFADVDDEAALLAEQERIVAARKKQAREAAQAQAQAQVQQGRVPPHMRGSFPDEGDGERRAGVSGGQIRAATPEELASRGIPSHLTTPPQDADVRTAQPPDPAAGVARPTETLSPRGRGRAAKKQGGVQVNPSDPGRGTANRNFRGPPR